MNSNQNDAKVISGSCRKSGGNTHPPKKYKEKKGVLIYLIRIISYILSFQKP